MYNYSGNALTSVQQKTAAAALGQSFSQDPFMTYLLPNAATRVQQLTKLFLPLIRCSLRYGGVEIAPEGGGALLWISGEYFPFRLSQIAQSSLRWIPFLLGLSAYRRLQVHEKAFEHALQEKAPASFAYLWVVGVHPHHAGRGLGKQMIQSALDSMQHHGHSTCVLRTENPQNVGLYEHLGFQQIHTDTPPDSKLQYWLLSKELV
ncbi:N-acetyltransferase [Acaryochloris sp. CCMEE 5410]|uniref:GNAT family N-acetyltransferase n=1 Tax=Acaryochloris sp. CCMEE 5410 TaxID=310037 RepID=UPI0002483B61|nr:GNAT family N-acetyltransferase [Acaryochloris sp. CCMEE 5410]KAI9129994.1 N-acetyltransferase [Acaryochloris sp. CCMEE 5410]